MDPMTTLVVSSAVGGAAGSFIKELSSSGMQWLVALVTAQSPEMQAAAKKNIENFVTRLAQRVERLENDIRADKSEIYINALNHPGNALLIKTAMVDSATTDNDEKHELLAELIAQRLTANADDMIALAGAAACSVVISLSSRQIRVLAVLALVQTIRPLPKAQITEELKMKDHINKFWRDNLAPLIVDGCLAQATPLDFEHLAAMGCIRISIASTSLDVLALVGFIEPEPTFTGSPFDGQEWYESLKMCWDKLGQATPTSIGQLIGILHKDAKLKTSTRINW